MVLKHSDMFDGEADIDDAYYGITLYGWELIKEDVKLEDLIVAERNLGINIVDVRGGLTLGKNKL